MHFLTFTKRTKDYAPMFSEIDIFNKQNDEKYVENELYKITILDTKKREQKIEAKLIKKEAFLWDDCTHPMAETVMGNLTYLGGQIPARRGDLMKELMSRFQDAGFRGKGTKFLLLTFEGA